MKRILFRCLLLFTAGLLLLSCGNDKKKKATESQEPSPAVVEPLPVITTVSTPENMVFVMHKVSDYRKWKLAYDADDSARLANGLRNYVIGRGLQDTNMVVVALKANDMAKAKAFASGAALKKTMQKAGVLNPSFNFMLATWQDTADIGPLPRSMNTFAVKDWNIWLKHFEEGAKDRSDHGIMARLVAHDADNRTQVSVVTALQDTAKAFAHYKSDAMKKRLADAGVVNQPKRFLFRIVARY